MTTQEQDTLFDHEEAVFNLQFSIVLVEHLRLLSRVLHKQYALSLNEYCVIVLIDALDQEISSTLLAQYFIFKRGTLLAMLASLEDRELIIKNTDPVDRRAMLISLTAEGHKLAHALAQKVSKLMKMTFWQSFPSSEYLAPLKGLEAQLAGIRGYPLDIPLAWNTKGITHALLFRIIRLIVDQWNDAVRQHSTLSFNECRVLLLLELYDRLKPSDIAQRLHLPRSGVSLMLKSLVDRKLIVSETSYRDGRSKVFRCTAAALTLSRKLLFVLRRTTFEAYKTYSDDAIITLNAQHIRMYSDLHRANHALDDILSK